MALPPEVLQRLSGHTFICGSDEVGLGSWAGPLVVCATVTATDWSLPGVTDSKKLSKKAREKLYPQLVSSVIHHLAEIAPEDIDRVGMSQAWADAHAQAIQGALAAHIAQGGTERPLLVVDGARSVLGAVALPKADLLVPAVSAASIIAKVYRDRIMRSLDLEHPGYGFSSNSGYGTKAHQKGLELLGVTKVHRMSYAPMSKMSEPDEPDLSDLMDLVEEILCDEQPRS